MFPRVASLPLYATAILPLTTPKVVLGIRLLVTTTLFTAIPAGVIRASEVIVVLKSPEEKISSMPVRMPPEEYVKFRICVPE